MSVKIEVHGIESSGTCSLSDKQGEVLIVTFSDGTITEAGLSLKALMQLLRMKLGQKPKVPIVPKQREVSEPTGRLSTPVLTPEVRQEVKTATLAVAVPAGNGPAGK